jgi:hypothetical protein
MGLYSNLTTLRGWTLICQRLVALYRRYGFDGGRADSILHDRDFTQTIREYGLKYPDAGYGSMFQQWLESDSSAPTTASATVRPCG